MEIGQVSQNYPKIHFKWWSCKKSWGYIKRPDMPCPDIL